MARSVDLGGAASEKHRAARLRAPRTRTSWGRQVLVAAEASCVTSVASIHLRTRRASATRVRSEEHTSELQSQSNLVCRLLLEKKKNNNPNVTRLRYTTHHLKPPAVASHTEAHD